MWKRKVVVLFLSMIFALFIGQSSAFALSFKYEFLGSVTDVALHEYGESLPDVQVGDTFSGFFLYQFDPTLEDQSYGNSVNFGIYNTFGSYEINFNDFSIKSNSFGYLPVKVANGSDDLLTFMDPVPDAGEYVSDDLFFKFDDTTGTALGDDSLPRGIDLLAFTDISLWFDIYGVSGQESALADGEVWGRIDYIHQVVVPVPEPATGLLMVAGLGLVGLVRTKTGRKV